MSFDPVEGVDGALEHFYRGSGAIYGFHCGNPYCDVKEGPGRPLNWCSRCHATPYCGAHCQKADWKNHKVDCKGKNWSYLRAMTFAMKFEDLFSSLAFACFYERGIWRGDERCVFVDLVELPKKYERPRFEIERVRLEPLPDPSSCIYEKVKCPDRQAALITFCFPSSRPGVEEDMYTEMFTMESQVQGQAEMGLEFHQLIHSPDPNYWKDFVNKLARGTTPIPEGEHAG